MRPERFDAGCRGERHFFGQACRMHGEEARRYVSTGQCVECCKERQRRARTRLFEAMVTMTKEAARRKALPLPAQAMLQPPHEPLVLSADAKRIIEEQGLTPDEVNAVLAEENSK